MRVQAKTDVGMVRNDNQDYFYYSTEPVGNLSNLFLVADGMGGRRHGFQVYGGDIRSVDKKL